MVVLTDKDTRIAQGGWLASLDRIKLLEPVTVPFALHTFDGSLHFVFWRGVPVYMERQRQPYLERECHQMRLISSYGTGAEVSGRE